jgi:hypothetical protein
LFGDGDDNASESSVEIHRPAQKKREQKQQDKLKRMEVSKENQVSKVSRSTTGRFEGKYKVGDKTPSGVIVKEIKEEQWQFLTKDKKGNNFYRCLTC